MTFRGLNKKKKERIYSIAKCAFLFILLVWAFKAVLVAAEPAQRIPVSHFPLCKSTLVPFKQPMVTLLWSVQLLQFTLKAQRGTLEGTSCFKVCTLLRTTFAVTVRFYFVLQTRGLCLLPDREPRCCLYLAFIF